MIEGDRKNFTEIKTMVKLFYTNPDKSTDFPLLRHITPTLCVQKLSTVSYADAGSSDNWNSWKLRQEATEQIGAYYELP